MPTVVINNVVYQNVPSVQIPLQGSGTATFFDTTGASATAAHILTGKTAFIASGSVSGQMANNGSTSGTISTKAGAVSIPAGYTSGGTVGISSTEQGKIVSGNIKSGVTILGVSGSASVVDTSDATASAATILSGATAYVNGAKVTGQMTAATVSQDGVTKVLSIS